MAPLCPGHLGAPWALWCARAPPVFGDAFWKPLTHWLDKIQQKKPSYHHCVLAVAPPRAVKTRAVSSTKEFGGEGGRLSCWGASCSLERIPKAFLCSPNAELGGLLPSFPH